MASLSDVMFEMSESECLSRIVEPGAFLFSLKRNAASSLTNTFNSTPAPASCKGFFAGLTLFDLFFFFLTLLKKYQKVQFACFALDKDGVLV